MYIYGTYIWVWENFLCAFGKCISKKKNGKNKAIMMNQIACVIYDLNNK